MYIKVKWCLSDDLFTHREKIFKSFEDFDFTLLTWLNQISDFKCIHIYNLKYNDCDDIELDQTNIQNPPPEAKNKKKEYYK